jgi:hypothetical protein
MSVRRTLGAWILLAALMVANGALREVALVPWLGRAAADALSAATGIAIILAVTRAFLRPLAGLPTAHAGRVALTWVGLTVAFEFLFGHYVDRKSWAELLANYAVWRGRLWPAVLAAIAAAPFLWTRRPTHGEGGARPPIAA